MALAEARSLIRQRHTIEDMAESLLKNSADYHSLRRIPGVGPITAMTVIAEAGDLRRFGHHRQFLKFCGLHLAAIQSDTFRGQTKLSKYGSARYAQGAVAGRAGPIRQRTTASVINSRDELHAASACLRNEMLWPSANQPSRHRTLSLTIIRGRPRSLASPSSSRATRRPDSDVSTTSATPSG